MVTLGAKIRKLRELRNIKQETMADLLGISQSSYSKMEKDETEMSPERLEQIAKALDLNVQDILGFDERVFFNVTNRDHSSGGGYTYSVNNNYGLTENEKKLYEDKIKLYEDKIKLLEEKCQYLEKENQRPKHD